VYVSAMLTLNIAMLPSASDATRVSDIADKNEPAATLASLAVTVSLLFT
jgi:hypothetical protein